MAVYEDIYDIVKMRLQLDNADSKESILSYIIEIGYRIKHYCNITSIPEDLHYVWASMVADAIRIDIPNTDGVESSISGGDNVRVGDTSVGGGGSSSGGGGVTNTSKKVIDSVVFDYRFDLNHYRKLRW